jgi:Alpha/beta hydrolase domain
MDSGHAAVEIVTTSPQQFTAFNAERYASLKVENGQQNEIIAQVGALLRSSKSPLAGPVRKMVMGGTSMSAGTLINYLPAHMVFRTPEMGRIFDGFMPTSNGSTIREIDVPLIQMPTMHEVSTNVTRRQDGDEPGKQYRLYEYAAIGHVDSRDNVRLLPNPCAKPLSTFLTQAYFSVTLHHLLRWVDEGIAPPRAQRILLDRDESNDGSSMALDAHGNPLGGIRSPYVDVPTAKYAPVNTAAEPLIANPSEYVRANGLQGAQTMCRLSAYQEPFSAAMLRELYGNKREYLRKFEARLDELEREGWSLPVYRDTILADVAKTEF